LGSWVFHWSPSGLGVDQPRSVVDNFWLGLALSVGVWFDFALP